MRKRKSDDTHNTMSPKDELCGRVTGRRRVKKSTTAKNLEERVKRVILSAFRTPSYGRGFTLQQKSVPTAETPVSGFIE